MTYKFLDNTYITSSEVGQGDHLEIEIGDLKQPQKFYPQFKLKRWWNETNLSIRLKEKDYDSATIVEEDNKVRVKILSYDNSGSLTQIVSNTLINNIAEYLSNYRMVNDYISIETAEVIDLGFELSIVLDSSQNQNVVIASVIDKINTYFNPLTRQLGQNVNLSELNRIVQSENGVLSITALSVFNNIGGQYSSSETSMAYKDSATKEIQPVDGTLFALPNQIYQIRFPNKDIRVKVKNFQVVSIS